MYVATVELHALDFSQARMVKEEEDKKAGLRPGQVHPADFEDELPFVASFIQISKVFSFGVLKPERTCISQVIINPQTSLALTKQVNFVNSKK